MCAGRRRVRRSRASERGPKATATRAEVPEHARGRSSASARRSTGCPSARSDRRSERAIIVEGYFDRIALARAGLPESLATCGTALTPEHARQLRRRTREVVLLSTVTKPVSAPSSAASRSCCPKACACARRRCRPRRSDSVLARDGADALRAIVDAAVPAVEAVIRRVSARAHATPWEKSDAVAAVAPLLALVADPVERSEHERQLALAVGVRPEDVKARVRSEHAQRSGGAHARDDGRSRAPSCRSPSSRWVRSALAARRRAPADPVSGTRAQRRRPRDRGTAPDSWWRRLLARSSRRPTPTARSTSRRSLSDSPRPPRATALTCRRGSRSDRAGLAVGAARHRALAAQAPAPRAGTRDSPAHRARRRELAGLHPVHEREEPSKVSPGHASRSPVELAR